MSIQFKPHDYQGRIIDWICAQRRAGVWAQMGSGKSVSTLTALDNLSLVEDVFPVLILAPLRVANSTWPDEVAKWAHLSHLTVSAISARRSATSSASAADRKAALNVKADIYTMAYDSLEWLQKELNGAWPFKTVVADEATRTKSFRLRQGGSRMQALAKMLKFDNTERFIALTGTPAPNGIKDLWGQTWFLDRGQRLGRTFSAFEMRWFTKGYDGYSLQPRPSAQVEVQELLRDICLTVDGLPVDDVIENIIYVDLPPAARKLYKEMEKQAFLELERVGVDEAGEALTGNIEIEAVNAAVQLSKLSQICNGFIFHEGGKEYQPLHTAKMEALESVMEEAAGASVLASYTFVPVRDMALKRFKQARTMDSDPETIRRWNRGETGLLLAHGASAGHGLSLQDGGNIMADLGLTWNLEHDMQIIERIGPQRQKQSGYDRPVFRHRIVARDTIEEHVMLPRLNSKRSVQELLLDAMRQRRNLI